MSMLPKSETGRKATAMILWGAITMTIGYGFMTLTTPTDEQIYERLSPDLRRQFDREKKTRREANDAALQQVFNQRNLDRPAWRTDVPKPLRTTSTTDSPSSSSSSKQRIPLSVDSGERVPEADRAVSR